MRIEPCKSEHTEQLKWQYDICHIKYTSWVLLSSEGYSTACLCGRLSVGTWLGTGWSPVQVLLSSPWARHQTLPAPCTVNIIAAHPLETWILHVLSCRVLGGNISLFSSALFEHFNTCSGLTPFLVNNVIAGAVPSHCPGGAPQGVCPCTDTGLCAAESKRKSTTLKQQQEKVLQLVMDKHYDSFISFWFNVRQIKKNKNTVSFGPFRPFRIFPCENVVHFRVVFSNWDVRWFVWAAPPPGLCVVLADWGWREIKLIFTIRHERSLLCWIIQTDAPACPVCPSHFPCFSP